jgi:integrase
MKKMKGLWTYTFQERTKGGVVRVRGSASSRREAERADRLLRAGIREALAQVDRHVRLPAPVPQLPTAADREAIVVAAGEEGVTCCAAVLLMVDARIRILEMAQLAWRDVDFRKSEVNLVVHKGPGSKVPLTERTSETLRRLQAIRGCSDFVFDAGPMPAARRRSPNVVKNLISAAIARAGLSYRPHLLRVHLSPVWQAWMARRRRQ